MSEAPPLVEVEVGHHHRPWPVNILSGQGGYVIVFGWAVKESTGTASAEIDLYDSDPAGGGVLAIPVTLSAGQSTSDEYFPQGLHFRNGFRPVVVTGTVAGSVWIDRPLWEGRGIHRP